MDADAGKLMIHCISTPFSHAEIGLSSAVPDCVCYAIDDRLNILHVFISTGLQIAIASSTILFMLQHNKLDSNAFCRKYRFSVKMLSLKYCITFAAHVIISNASDVAFR